MWLLRFTDYILRHRWQALALTFLSTLVSACLSKLLSNAPVLIMLLGFLLAIFLSTFGIVLAALITLIRGMTEGVIFTLAATLPYLIGLYAPANQDVPHLMLWMGIGFAVLSNVLTWVFAVVLKRQMSWSLLIQLAALLGVFVISVIHLIYPGVVDWWGGQLQALQSFYTQMAPTSETLKTVATNEAQIEWINISKQISTGAVTAVILCGAMLQLVAARWWQTKVFKPGMLQRELHNLRLSQLAGILFFGSLVLSYLGNVVVLDIMPVLYMLFIVAGLSLIHYLFGLSHSPTVWFWLAVFYLTLLLTWPFSVVLVAMFGWLDIWLNMRKRISVSH